MKTTLPFLVLVITLSILAVRSSAQAPRTAQPRPLIPAAFSQNLLLTKKFLKQNGGTWCTRPNFGTAGGATRTTTATAIRIIPAPPIRPGAPKTITIATPTTTLGNPPCTDTTGHILTTEVTDWITPGPINLTHDNNILVPGFRESPNNSFYVFPYLVKQTPQGRRVLGKSVIAQWLLWRRYPAGAAALSFAKTQTQPGLLALRWREPDAGPRSRL